MALPSDPNAEFLAFQEALAGRYSLERELGRGGMGIVYLAHDVALDRPVALKLLPPTVAVQPALRDRFVREARTAARLSHPHIVPIHAVEEVEGFVFFVMSFVEGETLGQRVRNRGPVHPREAARILREVAWALAYAHAQGVVHRDVKPDNILLEGGTGRALVTDFGIARAGVAAGLTSVGEILGTPEYMSPEQASGEEVDGRSDLYALGVVGHYMLSGKVPLQGANAQATLAKQLTQPAPGLSTVAPEVPRPLAEAIDRCLVKYPGRRMQGGEELADVLGRMLQERKEIPVAIRVFQEQSRDSAAAIAATGMMLLMGGGMLVALSAIGEAEEGVMLFSILLYTTLAMVPLGMLGVMARRLLKSGYGHDELVRALRSDVEERRLDLVAEVGSEDTALDVWAPRVAVGGLVLGTLSVLAILLPFVPQELVGNVFGLSYLLAVGGGVVAAVRHALRKAVPGQRWLRFWETPLGRGLFGLAGVGLGEARTAGGGSYRPTELAIGMAAERLFEELPKDVRKSLGDLPDVVNALEAHAGKVRARIKDLDRVLGELDDGGAEPGAAMASSDVAARRDSVTDDVREARQAAEQRLREVVAALEGVRLELLRLHAGSGTVESLTADVTAARALSADAGLLTEGRREVDAMLGHAHLLPEAATPTPG